MDGSSTNLPHEMRPMRESSNLAAKLGMMKKYGEMDEDNEEIFAMMADVEAIEGIDPITIKEESV